ncbi:MAG: hypothetical protein ACPGC9_01300 [Cytophagales bacterium]
MKFFTRKWLIIVVTVLICDLFIVVGLQCCLSPTTLSKSKTQSCLEDKTTLGGTSAQGRVVFGMSMLPVGDVSFQKIIAKDLVANADFWAFQQEIPDEIQNFLHAHRDKFKVVVDFITVSLSPSLIEVLSHVIVVLLPSSGFVIFSCHAYEEWMTGSFTLGHILFPFAFAFLCYAKLTFYWPSFEACKCYCLTDSGLVYIPLSTENVSLWIPYEDVVCLKRYQVPPANQVGKVPGGLDGMIDAINEKVQPDEQALVSAMREMTALRVADAPSGLGEIWIFLKENPKRDFHALLMPLNSARIHRYLSLYERVQSLVAG